MLKIGAPQFPVELFAIPDDEQLAFAFWNWWVALQMFHRGVPYACTTDEMVEDVRQNTLLMVAPKPESVAVVEALRLAAKSEFLRAGTVLRVAVGGLSDHLRALHEIEMLTRHLAADQSERQSEIARKPRADALNRVIRKLLPKDPKLSDKRLWSKLKELRGDEGIEEVNEATDCVVIVDGRGRHKSVPFSGLRDRIRREKRRS
jgi:hypothetical protein